MKDPEDNLPSRPDSRQYYIKPITIKTNSMSLPGHSQSRVLRPTLPRLFQYGQQAMFKFKRYHRIQTRRGFERNWYQVTGALLFCILVFSLTRLLLASTKSFGFSGNNSVGPRMIETLQALETLQYMTSSGMKVRLDKEKLFAGVRRARLYQGTKIRRQIMDLQKDPVIRVVKEDCLNEALRLKRRGFKPIVLDMAHREIPGGDYKFDGISQEAGLFRRTNLHQCLDVEPRRSEFYPLPIPGAVYCPNMIVLRKSSKENDAFMDRPDWMSFLVMAPLKNPPLVPNGADEMVLGGYAMMVTRKKIQNMFRIALENGHDSIVLSAFGCGRLGNPAESIAEIFKEVILTNYMGGKKQGRTFTEIVFAITTTTTTTTTNSNSKSLEDNSDTTTTTTEEEDDDDDDDDDGDENYNYRTFKRVMESREEIDEESEL
ncbi:hypothetical protein BGZ65_005192 [Modicella reniformis]|uniref:Microbial-type PARG catalytic domain-containing protein n=1 Tax=Modicella reniformis TaxID=1440133 RepID=A0A9P6LSQ9_9FUNG|nr:hypothetical protein BGZ65_005192 [Modicella reniformis]